MGFLMLVEGDEDAQNKRGRLRVHRSFSFSFFFLSLISLNFSQCWTLEPFTQPPSCLFIAKDGIWGHGSSPRRAGYFTPKLFGAPGEPEASLGEPGFRKKLKMTLFPLSLVIFHILDQNIE